MVVFEYRAHGGGVPAAPSPLCAHWRPVEFLGDGPEASALSPEIAYKSRRVSRSFSSAHAQVERGSVLPGHSSLFFPYIDRFRRLLLVMPH